MTITLFLVLIRTQVVQQMAIYNQGYKLMVGVPCSMSEQMK